MDIRSLFTWAWPLVATLVSLVSLMASHTDAAFLNDYIHDYQPLWFDHAHLHKRHSRVRRDVDPVLRWNFKAYGRTFKLQLRPDKSVFADDHTLEFAGKEESGHTDFFYEGFLTDVPNSRAHMAIHEGHISGQVFIPGQTIYFIEPARHHFGKNHTDFHTIIYPESRMDLDPYRHIRKNEGTCGVDLHAKLKKMTQSVGRVDLERNKAETLFEEKENPYLKYTAPLNSASKDEGHKAHRRYRRAAGELASTVKKTCIMHLRADQLLYNHFKQKYGNDDAQAKEAILTLFATHIKVLSQIFEKTTFADPSFPSQQFQGFNFVLQRSTIITECTGDYSKEYCEDTLDVTNYLHLTSDANHNSFCLVHTFTYRDFQGGTLGLAWVADPNSKNAGFCGKFGKVATSSGTKDQSLNTGIVSFINYNQDVPSRVSQLTFAHEVGHNFGAQHDQTNECAPFGTTQPDASDGNYIMFPKATPGTLPHNKEFSSCSRASIGKVMRSVGDVRENCFVESGKAFCGNNIVEDDEECDCGYKNDCTDECCNGREEKNTDCKLKAGKDCSPSQGLCCTQDCNFRGAGFSCSAATGCTDVSVCVDLNATCPEPPYKADLTFCNDHQAVCETGECGASVCLKIGWQECFETSATGASDEQMCHISCLNNATGECISSLDSDKVAKYPLYVNLLNTIRDNRNSSTQGVKRPPGSPCNDFKGYCDVFSKCRNVDSEGPFKQLTDLIFNPVTFSNIRDWISDHWWAVLLIAAGVIVFMGVFVKIFGYNTPSQDPKKQRRGQQGRGGRAADQRAGRRQDKRAAPYTTQQMPMQERSRGGGHSGGHSGAYGGAYGGNHGAYDNQGYYPEQAYRPPPPSYPGQQFDRIQGQRY